METTYTIGRLAEAAEVPVSTVRYYEQRGLIEPDQRTRASYRIYTEEGLKRLRFIKAAQGSGFTLEDIRLLLDLRDGAADPCGEVRGVVAKRLDAVGHQLRELRRVERVLRETLAWCDGPRPGGCCPAIEGLEAAASRVLTALSFRWILALAFSRAAARWLPGSGLHVTVCEVGGAGVATLRRSGPVARAGGRRGRAR